MKNARVFMFCLNSFPGNPPVGDSRFAGAASRKILGVMNALKSVNVPAIVVTSANGSQCNRVRFVQGLPVIVLHSQKNRVFRKLFRCINFALFSLCFPRSNDTVVMYNYNIEYFVAALVLWVRRIPVVLDLEDAPTDIFQNSIFFLISLIASRYISASEVVARSVKKPALAIPGVVRNQNCSEPLPESGTLRFHFGGTLNCDTGFDLFTDALRILEREYPNNKPFHFLVTGFSVNPGSVIRQLECFDFVDVDLNVEFSRLEEIQLSSHVSLSLKLSDGAYAGTTFPSKTIEICARKVLLVSTDCGGVSQYLNSHEYIAITRETGAELANKIKWIIDNRAEAAVVSSAGHKRVMSEWGERVVGEKIKTHLGL